MLQSKSGGLTQSMSFISIHSPHEITAAIIQPLVRWIICPSQENLRGDIEGRCEAKSPTVSYNCRFPRLRENIVALLEAGNGARGWDMGNHNPLSANFVSRSFFYIKHLTLICDKKIRYKPHALVDQNARLSQLSVTLGTAFSRQIGSTACFMT